MKAICTVAWVLTFLLLPLAPAWAVSAQAISSSSPTNYYVDQSNPQASDTNPGTEAQPWMTIGRAARVAAAGDTVTVKAGMYPERVQPAHSGSAGKRITFQAIPRRSVTMWGFYTQGADWVTIQGFNITKGALTGWTDQDGVFINSNDVQVIDNYFYNLESTAINGYWHDPLPQRAYVANNSIYHTQMGIVVTGADWVVENNEVSRLYFYGDGDSDYMRFFGDNHVIRGNYFHGTLVSEIGTAHVDCFQTFDNNGEHVYNITFEGNWCSDFHQGFMGEAGFHHNSSHITFKNNVFAHGWAWGLCVFDIPYVTAVNNDFIDIAYHGIGLRGDAHDGVVRNNIFAGMETSYWFADTASIDGDYNLVYHAQAPGVPGQHDQVGADPHFANPAADDYHLLAGSPAIDAGWGSSLTEQDYDGVLRPQMKTWDVGAFEYQPPLILSGWTGNGTAAIAWQVHAALPGSATWQIETSPAVASLPTPISAIPNGARAYTLTGLANYTLYTITLTAIDGGQALYTASVQLFPSDHVLSLPLIR
jgi:hypothetical protein